MDKRDHEFEKFLREFEPQRLTSRLPLTAQSPVNLQRIAAVAVVGFFLGASIWEIGKESDSPAPSRGLNTESMAETAPASVTAWMPLTHLALKAPERLDAKLAESSRGTLPNFQKRDSALRTLAKD
jgi:hypothetical protein